MKKTLWDLLRSEEGLETVEYAMILAFISLGLVAAIVFLSGAVSDKFNGATSTVNTGS